MEQKLEIISVYDLPQGRVELRFNNGICLATLNDGTHSLANCLRNCKFLLDCRNVNGHPTGWVCRKYPTDTLPVSAITASCENETKALIMAALL